MEKNRNVSLQVDGKSKKKKDKGVKVDGGEPSTGGREKCSMMWDIHVFKLPPPMVTFGTLSSSKTLWIQIKMIY